MYFSKGLPLSSPNYPTWALSINKLNMTVVCPPWQWKLAWVGIDLLVKIDCWWVISLLIRGWKFRTDQEGTLPLTTSETENVHCATTPAIPSHESGVGFHWKSCRAVFHWCQAESGQNRPQLLNGTQKILLPALLVFLALAHEVIKCSEDKVLATNNTACTEDRLPLFLQRGAKMS